MYCVEIIFDFTDKTLCCCFFAVFCCYLSNKLIIILIVCFVQIMLTF